MRKPINPDYEVLKSSGMSKAQARFVVFGEDFYEWRVPQLKEIRLAYKNGVDPAPWCNPIYSENQMKQLRLAAEEGVDYSAWLTPRYSFVQMSDLLFAAKNNLDYRDWLSMGEYEMRNKRLSEERRLRGEE